MLFTALAKHSVPAIALPAAHGGGGATPLEAVALPEGFGEGATNRAVQVLGSRGLTPGNTVERLHRDAPMNVIGGFASNRLRELVAQQIGLPPTYQPFDRLDGTGLDLDPHGLRGANK
ncbi:acyl-CoA dehydrogenase family protein [Micromonospora sp. CB01531]|uniref:acyl-CoA dehydrogenase family protein n=1 Tax=Micromonospora sp. CB01531 TaxID=1718947 RepID=UPI00093B9A2B|nr:acyl-CoA dehydrogenase family protein [Micromonospora sp. CB01531]OKI46818.1 hypothetical protein A6A27_36795 [Micromonospora sp. CB01531]